MNKITFGLGLRNLKGPASKVEDTCHFKWEDE